MNKEIIMVVFNQNWADEFNYPVVEFFTKRFWNFLIFNKFLFEKAIKGKQKFYFGFSEWFELSVLDVFRLYIKNKQEITSDVYKCIQLIYFKLKFTSKCLINSLIESLRKIYSDIKYNRKHPLREYQKNIERIFEEYNKNLDQLKELNEENSFS